MPTPREDEACQGAEEHRETKRPFSLATPLLFSAGTRVLAGASVEGIVSRPPVQPVVTAAAEKNVPIVDSGQGVISRATHQRVGSAVSRQIVAVGPAVNAALSSGRRGTCLGCISVPPSYPVSSGSTRRIQRAQRSTISRRASTPGPPESSTPPATSVRQSEVFDGRTGRSLLIDDGLLDVPGFVNGVAIDGRGSDFSRYELGGDEIGVVAISGNGRTLWKTRLLRRTKVVPRKTYFLTDGFSLGADRCGDVLVNISEGLDKSSFYGVIDGATGRVMWSRSTGPRDDRIRFARARDTNAAC